MSTRKFLISALTAAALGAAALPASAADIGVFGAYWDTADADQALGFGTKLRIGRFFELRGTYFSDVTSDVDPEVRDFEIRTIPLEAGVAFNFADDSPVSPYVGGGAGYYLLNASDFEMDDEVGWYVVGGLDFGRQASGMAFNVEAIYRGIEASVRNEEDELPEVDENVDLDLSGLGLNAGLVFRF